MDVVTLTRAVSALGPDRLPDGHPLRSEAFVDSLRQLIPCEGISLVDLDLKKQESTETDLVPWPSYGDDGPFWDHFWSSLACSFTEAGTEQGTDRRCLPATTTDFYSVEQWHATGMYNEVFRPDGIEWDLVLPLPSKGGTSRRLVFFREPGRPFGDTEKAAAAILRPHIVEAMRAHGRSQAAGSLTPRQQELLILCAMGLDNRGIARRIGVSAGTVRKHLENTYLRLGVSSRGEAVAALLPDLAWA
jgi:DNA-binding CsgD family transcriptional regulator